MSLARVLLRSRALHTSVRRLAITELEMPAMSPTMTEGGIAAWKVKDGAHFAAGDVLLEIETDKATMDVEAQDDGVMGKIIMPDGSKNVQVGKVIALLAEEGDDISNLEAPKESSALKPAPPKEEPKPTEKQPTDSGASPSPASGSPPSTPQPLHNHPYEIETSHPLFPSVHRLLEENNIHDASKIKGTGIRGMLTKGDVLAYLGLASNPYGTFQEEAKAEGIENTPVKQAEAKKEGKPEVAPLDGPAWRAALAQGLANLGKPPVAPVHRECTVLQPATPC
ncbi:single hybrid motif-containing protein [Calocera cornea HHB12733]|uniref:Single hybrid motif-containing protein n=1 Tax=Calocera cornea HHB12733 TaxID=1353952 RepID=A0A165CK27_9BASI|nr:single hybrid motif-containing protein [Calocera cornea HHB12733]